MFGQRAIFNHRVLPCRDKCMVSTTVLSRMPLGRVISLDTEHLCPAASVTTSANVTQTTTFLPSTPKTVAAYNSSYAP